jgi:hypothetical protein
MIALYEQWKALPAALPEMVTKDLVRQVLSMRERRLREEIANLRFLQDEAEQSENEEQQHHYQTLVNAAKEKLRLIHQASERRSIMGRRRIEAEKFGLTKP